MISKGLVEFLLARIAEVEERAQSDMEHFSEPDRLHMDRWIHQVMGLMLAKCAAERLIVERHSDVVTGIVSDHGGQDEVRCCAACGTDLDEEDCPDLLCLASAHSDHPDFQEDWKVCNVNGID